MKLATQTDANNVYTFDRTSRILHLIREVIGKSQVKHRKYLTC